MNPIFKLFVASHVRLFRVTHGKIGSTMDGVEVLLLTTKGAKSGQARTVPVMAFQDSGHRVVIGSAAGSPDHPAWFKNLQKNPEVTVEVKGRRYAARAELANADERARIWKKVMTEHPRFAGYEKKAQGREIPVVVLKEGGAPPS